MSRTKHLVSKICYIDLMPPVIFAILAAITFGLWTVFHQAASAHINQIFGAILVSFTAVIAGTLVLLPQLKNVQLVTDQRGVYFLILAGVAAFALDFFALQAYSKGLPITVGGPIIIGGSIAIAVVVGFLLGEPVTLTKLIALALVISGATILAMTMN